MDTNIAGGSGTRRLRERAVLLRNSAGAGGFKKTVSGRALIQPQHAEPFIDLQYFPVVV